MSTVKYVAMLSSLKISGAQERILARYLKEHFGKRFCPAQTAVGALTNGHTDVNLVLNCGLIKEKISRRQLSGGN
jgi:hypothetical protein